jgi:hypothetical protein
MITIDCPLCAGTAELDDDLAALSCITCDTLVEVAIDPLPLASGLERAA